MGLMAGCWFPLQPADITGAGRASQVASLSMLNPQADGNPPGCCNLSAPGQCLDQGKVTGLPLMGWPLNGGMATCHALLREATGHTSSTRPSLTQPAPSCTCTPT